MSNGGPAFPRPESDNSYGQEGMSLRDYFAGQALMGLCSGEIWPAPDDGPEMARRAYAYADAMLKAREGKS